MLPNYICKPHYFLSNFRTVVSNFVTREVTSPWSLLTSNCTHFFLLSLYMWSTAHSGHASSVPLHLMGWLSQHMSFIDCWSSKLVSSQVMQFQTSTLSTIKEVVPTHSIDCLFGYYFIGACNNFCLDDWLWPTTVILSVVCCFVPVQHLLKPNLDPCCDLIIGDQESKSEIDY